MRNRVKYIVLFCLVLLSVSCVTNRNTRLLQERGSLPEYDSASFAEHKLRVNDELYFKVVSLNKDIMSAFNLGSTQSTQSSSSISYRIYHDGTIDIPFADSIPVVGLTLLEASAVIEDRLKPISDDITVKLLLAHNDFYMVGSSGKGKYPIYKDRLTIYQAIAMAGFSPGVGNLKKVKIIREQEDNTSSIVTFDLRTESIIGSEYYYVQPNDVIYVSTSKGNFFRIQSFTSLIALVSSSLTFLLLMLDYTK
jgi:polysaccharide export outer membrane protein